MSIAGRYDWDVFGEESPTEIHHKDCRDTPDSHPTGDANAAAVENPEEYAHDGEEFDVSCECLDPLLGADRRDDPRLDGILSPRESRADVLDTAADLAHDAVEFGDVDTETVADALEEAAREVRDR